MQVKELRISPYGGSDVSHSSMLVGVVVSPVLPPVLEAGVTACEDVCACTNHVLREGKLLAVENEEISVLLEMVLRPSTFLLQSSDLVLLVFDEFSVLLDILVVIIDIFGI